MQLPMTRVQFVAPKKPTAPVLEKLTVPVGVLADPGETSETVAIHVESWLIATVLGEHNTDVRVLRFATVTIAPAEWVVSPLVPIAVKTYDPGVEDKMMHF